MTSYICRNLPEVSSNHHKDAAIVRVTQKRKVSFIFKVPEKSKMKKPFDGSLQVMFFKTAVVYFLSKRLKNNCTKINTSVILQGFFSTDENQLHSRTAFYREHRFFKTLDDRFFLIKKFSL